MSACTNTTEGNLLHAYELGLLSEAEREQFEIHLLHCEDCRSSITSFEVEVETLREIMTSPAEESPKIIVSSIGISRPVLWWAVAASLILLSALQPFWHPFNNTNQIIREVQIGGLLQTRSGPTSSFEVQSGKDFALCFSVANANAESVRRVTVAAVDGPELYNSDHFSGFDAAGVGCLLIPHTMIREGDYVLTVWDTTEQAVEPAASFRFRLIPTASGGSE